MDKRPRILLALVALAACEPGTSPAPPSFGGTYAGGTGTATYRLAIPEGGASPFGVSGTIVENGERTEVRGSGVRTGDEITLELVRTRDSQEQVFGFSGTVGAAGGEIALRRAGSRLVLRRS